MISVDGVDYDLTDGQKEALAKLYKMRSRELPMGNASRAVNARAAHSLAALDLVEVVEAGRDGYPTSSRPTARLTEAGVAVCEAFTVRAVAQSLVPRKRR